MPVLVWVEDTDVVSVTVAVSAALAVAEPVRVALPELVALADDDALDVPVGELEAVGVALPVATGEPDGDDDALPLASVPGDAWWRDALTVLALLAVPHFQIVHFYFTHRVMHRWPRCCTRRGVPDVGQFLYQHVHSLHHKAKDPTAFSGISMHPVESALFFTTMPIACLLGLHPIVFLHAKFYNISAAMLGHESFGDPSTGGHSHWLHHKLVDCNFGGNFVPLDWVFGSHVADEAEFEARAAKARSAAAALAETKGKAQ